MLSVPITKGRILADRWYVLSCAPRKERVIYHQLHDRGFDVYYPYLIIKTQNPNMLKIEPYFPGYLFIKVDLEQVAFSTFQWMPMTEGLVCSADRPLHVPDRIVKAIHRSLWRVNSTVLGVPIDLGVELKEYSELDAVAGNGDLFNQQISGSDRSQFLYQYLQFVSQSLE